MRGQVESVARWWEGHYYPDAGEVVGWRETRLLREGERTSWPVVPRPVAGSARVPAGPAEDNAGRAVRRARTRIRRYATANRLNRLMVLTWAPEADQDRQHDPGCGGCDRCDLARARRHVRNFVRWGLRDRLGYRGAYVIGWERHKSGAWHANVLVDRFIPHEALERAWGRGFVWINRFAARRGEGGRAAARRAAAYVAKYVAKDLAGASRPGQHRYEVAQGFVVRVERVFALSATGIIEATGCDCVYRFDAVAPEAGRGPPMVWAALIPGN